MKMPVLLLLFLFLAAPARAQDASVPGTPTAPHPTFEHISLEWPLEGDANRDGVVRVRYRAEGESAWQEGLPLMHVPAGSNAGFTWAHRHAGSLFGLRPDTVYRIELELEDPDGGGRSEQLQVRTRRLPVLPSVPPVAVSPSSLEAALGAAGPDTVLQLSPGRYPPFTIGRDGAPGQPIVLQGGPDVIVEGDVRIDGRSDVWVQGLEVHGQLKFNGATRISITDCTVRTDRDGIVAFGSGSTDGYFADNRVFGPTVWAEASLGVDGDNRGEGIVMTGAGNVIAYNRVVGFRDCISTLEDSDARNQTSIDIIGNDIENCADDGIEADFTQGNVRVLRNRLKDTFMAISSQPSLGGPSYFMRNLMFNVVYHPFKLNRTSSGNVVVHNTVLKSGDALAVAAGAPIDRLYARNNIFIGGPNGRRYRDRYPAGDGDVLQLRDVVDASADLDYDAFGVIGVEAFRGRLGSVSFETLDELRANTTEAHASRVDLSIFAASIPYPDAPFSSGPFPDLQLAAGPGPIDSAEPLPGVNTSFGGVGPDRGALEAGFRPFRVGPRAGPPPCGDGVLEPPEACDDGNQLDGDGCARDCSGPGAGVPSDAGAPEAGMDGGLDLGPAPDATGLDTGDSGSMAPDTGPPGDVGVADQGARPDVGPSSSPEGGCGCRSGGQPSSERSSQLLGALTLLGLGLAQARRRPTAQPHARRGGPAA